MKETLKDLQKFQAINNSIKLDLNDLSPETKYVPPKDSKKISMQFEQRKLLMSDILFLTNYGEQSDIVVYVGAAPGLHIPFLSSLFPTHTFILIDKDPFR